MKANTNGQIITANMITLIIDSEVINVPQSHVSYQEIKDILLSDDPTPWDLVKELSDASVAITRWAQGLLQIEDGVIKHDGRVIHNTLTNKIIRGMSEGNNVKPFINFLENLMSNPLKSAVDELYLFLEQSGMPITEDGHFLAYKNVTDDYKDKHSRTFDNRVGSVCEVPRNSVDDNRQNTCSYGLHFAALSYLQEMWGFSGNTMIVKINPADVVAIPYDYDNAKGRTCRYEVIGQASKGNKLESNFTSKTVWGDEENDYGYDDDRAHGW